MMKAFEMTDLGLMNYFLGIEVKQQEDDIFISQKKYIEALLKKFKMYDCKPVATPLMVNEKLQKDDRAQETDASRYKSLIGSLLYLTITRPDIMYATSLLSTFMQKPSQIHYGVGKRILRYLQGTKEFGIWYKTITNSRIIGYTDSDWAGSIDDMKSTSGYAFSLGSGIFSWVSKKQATVAQSTVEAEYVAAAEATSQAIWLRRILKDMGEKQRGPTTIYCDNKSTIAMTKNPVHHSRTKHIAIKYHFIREAETNMKIRLDCVEEDPVLPPDMKQVVISLSQILLSSTEWGATLAGNSQQRVQFSPSFYNNEGDGIGGVFNIEGDVVGRDRVEGYTVNALSSSVINS
ncbi:uncharacterized protein LOC114189605 [Vigna unguiculata]|uniref:uncharacterized protein LOC114189605 n=1 Tax=Vigna unguiculata TaxID=3917 RepID=UPI0010166646|nr:uncharacterized protein LOC114189605 [Vigna unguiculata]